MTLSYSPSDRPTLEANLALARQNGDFASEAGCLMALGDIAKDEKEYDLAQGLYGQAWAAYERADDRQGQANSLKTLGDLLLGLWRVQGGDETYLSALTIYNYALTLYRAINDIHGEALLFMAKGDLEIRRDRTQETSIAHYQTALSLFTSIGDLVGEAHTLLTLCATLHSLKRNVSDLMQRPLTLYEGLQDSLGQAQTFELLARIAQEDRDFKQASTYLERAITLYEYLGQTDKEAELWILLGRLTQAEKNSAAAIAHFDKALALFIARKDTTGVKKALYALYKFAHVSRDEVSIWREVGDLVQEVDALEKAGQQAKQQKNLALAREFFQQALVLDDTLYDVKSQRLSLLRSLADVVEEQGDLASAFGYYKQLIAMKQWHKQNEANLLEKMGKLLLDMNEIDQAILYFHKSGDAWLATLDAYRQGFILETIAHVEMQRQNISAARQALQDALTAFSVPHCVPFRPGVLWQLGVLEAEQNHDEEARRYFQQAWEIGLERSLIYKHIETLWHWGRFEWSRGNRQIGCEYCQQALALAAQNQKNNMVQQMIPLNTWQQELAAMNCPPEETSHDA